MSTKTVEIIEQLKTLTLVETSELVKQIEVTFCVDVSANRVIPIFPTQKNDSTDNVVVESRKNEFDIASSDTIKLLASKRQKTVAIMKP